MCLYRGELEVKMLSPVFSQNVYQGVYDDLQTNDIPEWLSFFALDEQNYPLLKEVEAYILDVKLQQGDCLFTPAFWWISFASNTPLSTFMQFTYEPSSKLTELLFEAIRDGTTDN